jgi:hypothetical protein
MSPTVSTLAGIFLNAAVCLAMVLPSTARSDQTAADDSCAVADVRTDIRPTADGPPTRVDVSVYMIDLLEISDIRQTLTGDFGVRLSWMDPRLAHLDGCEISLSDIWSPGLVVLNSGRQFAGRPEVAGIGPGGQVKYVQRYYGSFATYHSLHDFPFDKQTFRISLLSPELLEKDIELVPNEKETGRRPRLNISDWIIEGVTGTIGRERSESTGIAQIRYDFNISAQRIISYYLWKVILPLCLIVAMSWSVFWINPAQYGPQIGLSATSMLTLIAFIFATTTLVPKLGYLTRLDYFVVGSTVLVFLALIESVAMVYIVAREKAVLAMRIDRVSRLVFPLAFGVLALAVFML